MIWGSIELALDLSGRRKRESFCKGQPVINFGGSHQAPNLSIGPVLPVQPSHLGAHGSKGRGGGVKLQGVQGAHRPHGSPCSHLHSSSGRLWSSLQVAAAHFGRKQFVRAWYRRTTLHIQNFDTGALETKGLWEINEAHSPGELCCTASPMRL